MNLAHHPRAVRLQARIDRLAARVSRTQQQQAALGRTYADHGEIGGIRARSSRCKEQRLERTIRLAKEATAAAQERARLQADLAAFLAGRTNAQGRAVSPKPPRTPCATAPCDTAQAIERGLSLDGQYVLADGARLSLWVGWDLLQREPLGVARLDTPDGRRVRRYAPSIQGCDLYDTAVALAREPR